MGTRSALLIGNASFAAESGLEPLRGPPNDVAGLETVLGDPECGGFTVRPLVDAGRDVVLPAIEDALSAAEADDLVLLFYAGHGRLDGAGRLCLATRETDSRRLRSTSIPVSELKEMVSQSRAGSVILLLDCCFSGAIGKEFLRGGVDDQLALMREAQGLHILTAATGLQTARERDSETGGLVMGAFTRAIVDGIASGAADHDGDGVVTLSDLRRHLAATIRGQTPKYLAHEASGEPVVARVRPRESPAQRRARRLGAWYAEGAVSDPLYAAMSAALESHGEDRLPTLLRRLLDNPDVSPAAVVAAWEGATRPPPRRATPPPPPPPRGEVPLAEPPVEPPEPILAAARTTGAAGPSGAVTIDFRTRLIRIFNLDALPLVTPDRPDGRLLVVSVLGAVPLGWGLSAGQLDGFVAGLLPMLLLFLFVQKMLRVELGVRAFRRGAPPPDAFLRGPFTPGDAVAVLVATGAGAALLPFMNYSARRDTALAATLAVPVAFIARRWWRGPPAAAASSSPAERQAPARAPATAGGSDVPGAARRPVAPDSVDFGLIAVGAAWLVGIESIHFGFNWYVKDLWFALAGVYAAELVVVKLLRILVPSPRLRRGFDRGDGVAMAVAIAAALLATVPRLLPGYWQYQLLACAAALPPIFVLQRLLRP